MYLPVAEIDIEVYKFSLSNLEAVKRQVNLLKMITPQRINKTHRELSRFFIRIRDSPVFTPPNGIDVLNNLIGIGHYYSDFVCRSTIGEKDLFHNCSRCIHFDNNLHYQKKTLTKNIVGCPCTLATTYRKLGAVEEPNLIYIELQNHIKYLDALVSRYYLMFNQGVFKGDTDD